MFERLARLMAQRSQTEPLHIVEMLCDYKQCLSNGYINKQTQTNTDIYDKDEQFKPEQRRGYQEHRWYYQDSDDWEHVFCYTINIE